VADFTVLAAAASSFAVNANRALAVPGRAAQATEVPADLAATRGGGGVPLDVAEARAAVAKALVAAGGVVGALRILRDAFRLATDTGLVGPETNLTQDGTRISGVTITAQGARLVDAIDELVASAATSGANLIASDALRVTIQTTQFGGRITVAPQPLDSVGLGIRDLSAISREDAAASLNRIEAAITLAETRVDNLTALQDSLAPGGQFTNQLARLISAASPGFLPRGSLVNQIA
jgi:hypothetical protein